MSDDNTTEEDETPATREFLELKLSSFRSEMRMLFVIAVAGNQLLAHLSLSPTVGFIGGMTAAGFALVKIALLR